MRPNRFKIKPPIQLKAKDVPILRQKLLKKQNGICPICTKTITDACLDHSHTKRIKGTGKIRGVLCRTCNVFIAKSENNCTRYGIKQSELPSILRACAKYLEQRHLPFLHPSEAPKRQILKKSSYNKLKKAYDGRARFPVYTEKKKGKHMLPKPNQILTKALEKLFIKYNIKPEFYK